ncbi:acid phosphatase 1-like [Bidens hawaiensis]|uniref:acid phosphatase 1-like n=1 Tax=Bidens hawaiensis TaxID=980011 RepID=UPI00404A83A5
MKLFKSFLLLSLLSVAFCDDPESHLLPRPLIIQLPESGDHAEETRLMCAGWRVAVEANNLSPWKTVPEDCVDYVKEYMLSRAYLIDIGVTCNEAERFARSFEVNGDGMDAWIFDIDETLLSNLPYYVQHGYGSEIFDNIQFDKWVIEGVAQAIKPSLDLYNEVLKLGFKIFLVTGRTESKRDVTVNNLINAGFEKWDRLILRGNEDHGKPAVAFKSDKRKEIMEEGYRIIGNSGDQLSDLLGSHVSMRSFKLSNPMYFIS